MARFTTKKALVFYAMAVPAMAAPLVSEPATGTTNTMPFTPTGFIQSDLVAGHYNTTISTPRAGNITHVAQKAAENLKSQLNAGEISQLQSLMTSGTNENTLREAIEKMEKLLEELTNTALNGGSSTTAHVNGTSPGLHFYETIPVIPPNTVIPTTIYSRSVGGAVDLIGNAFSDFSELMNTLSDVSDAVNTLHGVLGDTNVHSELDEIEKVLEHGLDEAKKLWDGISNIGPLVQTVEGALHGSTAGTQRRDASNSTLHLEGSDLSTVEDIMSALTDVPGMVNDLLHLFGSSSTGFSFSAIGDDIKTIEGLVNTLVDILPKVEKVIGDLHIKATKHARRGGLGGWFKILEQIPNFIDPFQEIISTIDQHLTNNNDQQNSALSQAVNDAKHILEPVSQIIGPIIGKTHSRRQSPPAPSSTPAPSASSGADELGKLASEALQYASPIIKGLRTAAPIIESIFADFL